MTREGSPPAITGSPLPRVLVVEDDADHRLLLSRRLGDAGYQVALAANGDEAIERVADADVVLLDYKLPGSDGLDVLDAIGSRYPAGGPSVVMVTGAGSQELVVEAMQRGAVDYVVKDTSYFSRIATVVDRAWRHHELERRAERLQDLVLLVTSATDRDEVFSEIVNGARELLEAANCTLVLRDRGLDVVAQAGAPVPIDEVTTAAAAAIDRDGPVAERGRLIVRLPAGHGDIVGVLVVHRAGLRLTDQEVRLAETFASFAGLALDRLRRFELEHQLVAELQRTIDQRQEFIASVSHELRTPLACILGFAETLTAHWRSLPDDDRLNLVERMGRHSVELHDLVDQLLEVAARNRGRQPIDPGTLSLDGMVRAVLDDLAPVLAGREVAVEVPELEVTADPHLVGRVLTNLVSNAAKYSSPGRPIAVCSTLEGRCVRVAVTDEGVGIPPDELSRVFEPFWRGAHATSSAARGTGIGLSLVKEYVNAMGGQVHVSSRPGEGSTFSFTLPLAAAAGVS